jgi:hypothetical protein
VLLGFGAIALITLGAAAYLFLPLFALRSTEAEQRAGDTQIVVQWLVSEPASSTDAPTWKKAVAFVRFSLTLRRLFSLENTLVAHADGAYWDDGNDIGSGTFNVYLYAHEPDRAVRHIVALYRDGNLMPGMRIAVAHYANAARTDWVYRPVFPPGLRTFELMHSETSQRR